MKDTISDWSRLLNLSPNKIIIPLQNNKHKENKGIIKFIYIGGLITFASTVIILFTLDISG